MKNLTEITEKEIHSLSYDEIAAIITENQDLNNVAYVRFLSISRKVDLTQALQNTVQYQSRVTKIISLYKNLSGSEKQIKWASQIRDTKTRDFAYQLTLAQYAKILKDNNFESEYELQLTNDSVNQKYNYVLSNQARTIIDNR